MVRPETIAIDGPAGSGKSTIGQALATRLHYAMVDTGLIYRLVARGVLDSGTDPDDWEAVLEVSIGVLKDVDEIYAAKGKRIIHVDLKRDKPPRAELLEVLLGPTGNLRAPTIRKGRTLIVGFDEATYERVLG